MKWIWVLLLGILVNQYTAMGSTGRTVWVCTYSVVGQMTQVTLDHPCPPSMDFK